MLWLSCEHATYRVPRRIARALGPIPVDHRAFDPGAAWLARRLARSLSAPLHAGRISRWAIDLNRSPSNPAIFSAAARRLPPDVRAQLLHDHHRPHWEVAQAELTAMLQRHGWVVHVGVHSFTPVLAGRVRGMDLGLLYDPARAFEREIAAAWVAQLQRLAPSLAVRRNAPYRGVSDGLTRHLRRRLDHAGYAGIELELNQSWVQGNRVRPPMVTALVRSLAAALAEVGAPEQTAHRGGPPRAPTADREK